MRATADQPRIAVERLQEYAVGVFARLGTPEPTARLAARSLLDASLLGIETHGIESLDMYVAHLRGGGLDPLAVPERVGGRGAVQVWDLRRGIGIAAARTLMAQAMELARAHGIALITCRNANHIAACGVYAKIAADAGLIGVASQQTLASIPPWGGKSPRLGQSPLAFVAPVEGRFPFYFDASMGEITRGRIKEHLRAGKDLPAGVALDADGHPTTDPRTAWDGQILAIGRHKGTGLIMALEVLEAVLSGSRFSALIPSIVDEPEKSADTGAFLAAIDPDAVAPPGTFARRMREYTDYVESAAGVDPATKPRYPGRREGELWADRSCHGVPLTSPGLERLDTIADSLGMARLKR